ncbi:N-acetylmuramoyl-L-alanine amidase [Flavobacterium crocinum]|uniref:N-acetylmuramoyl-L-alanine amidase n=1 Tax=Flavobacterium crocinum TaxID=2183896 RepID=A0A2S1YI16_9FLAO|nr:N-acetylmuramoyl-L-alanine amidase [Flavobacterium crocinum]AWK03703.1 N-acetylmuramoyl-L-alanine amidase [Flavobacterium crocinum]
MKFNRNFLGIASAVFLFGLFAFIPLEEKKIVVIDAAHGGNDLGADYGGGLQEKLIVERIAKLVQIQNKDNNLEIVLLRDGDQSIELAERVSIINKLKPALVISLHANASKNITKNGAEAYIAADGKFYNQSKESAETLLQKVAAENLSKGSVSGANFFILKKSNCPAVTLEVGYLSNEKDRKYITSEKGQIEIAKKILESLE